MGDMFRNAYIADHHDEYSYYDEYADAAARELQAEIDFQVMKELMLKIGSVCVVARDGVEYSDVEAWSEATGVRMPIGHGQEYIFAIHEDATAFVLRFG